jgi:hypothetical protein
MGELCQQMVEMFDQLVLTFLFRSNGGIRGKDVCFISRPD